MAARPSRWRRADGFDAVVAFCGKFADWKRLDALLRAAAIYEQHEKKILTLVVGSGPHEAQVQMHDLAAELGLRRTYFVGPRPQDELTTLFNCADVGCFPSYREPFGLVFIECMACGTPVIGADSGGPRDFVTPEVGMLVPGDRRPAGAGRLARRGRRPSAVDEDWKQTKGPVAQAYVTGELQRDEAGGRPARRGGPADRTLTRATAADPDGVRRARPNSGSARSTRAARGQPF